MPEPDLEILETEEGGNTINPSSSSKKQSLQHLHHTFTYNNYPIEAIEILIALFNHIAYDYVFQEERGESGTPHLQGVVSLKKRMRWSEFGLPKDIHWESVKHVPLCYEYCSRANKRHGNCWSLKYPIPTKLELIEKHNFNTWMNVIEDYIKTKPNKRTIRWVWSAKGRTKKSDFCKYLAYHHNATICSQGKYSDIMNIMFKANMDKSRLVVIDLPRNNGNKISYSALESIKNGLIVNTKYETGSKLFNPPHIVVFSNMPPVLSAMSADRWEVMDLDSGVI